MQRLFPRAALAIALASLLAPTASAQPYVEVEGPRPWYTMLKPARRTPATQLAYARSLRDGGSLRRAHRHYRALVASWPSAPEAPIAQLEHAQLLDRRGRATDAFEAYQELLEKYPGDIPFDELYQRQLAIAIGQLDSRRMRLLFGGLATPERAIPLLEQVAANAPSQPDAARARLLLARAHQRNGDPAKAAAAFAVIEQQHPDDPAAEAASLGRAQSLDELARRSPGDQRLAEEAWFAFERFVRVYPDSEHAAEARDHRDRHHRNLARMSWDQARFYERRSARPTSAIGPYERFLERFADTEWADSARERLAELQALQAKETVP